jgi:hypothetical protein
VGNRRDVCRNDGSAFDLGQPCPGNHRCEGDRCTDACVDGFRNCSGACVSIGQRLGACRADALRGCESVGATCIVVRDEVCERQICLWPDRTAATCAPPGLWTEACSGFSIVNPGAVPAGKDGECLRTAAGVAPVEGCRL